MCQAFLEPGDRYGAVLSTSRLSFSDFLTQIHLSPTLLGHRLLQCLQSHLLPFTTLGVGRMVVI